MAGRRRGGGGGGGHGGGEERWLLPYSDMITLLLGLFIVLFAMSTIDAKQFDNLRRSLSQTFHGTVLDNQGQVLPGSNGVGSPNAASSIADPQSVMSAIKTSAAAQAERQSQQQQSLEAAVAASGLGKLANVTSTDRGVRVSIAGDALFESGKHDIKPAMRRKLLVLERQFRRMRSPNLSIDGFTDGQPFNGPGGNIALSQDRARAVMLLFASAGYPELKLQTSGNGAQRPVVAPPRNNPHADMKQNRRIEITLLAPGGNDQRPLDVQYASAAMAHGVQDPTPRAVPTASTAVHSTVRRQLPPSGSSLTTSSAGTGIVEQLASTSKANS